jgi:peptidyl-prolyl cis-trans isomerase A (cyclophilin A)
MRKHVWLLAALIAVLSAAGAFAPLAQASPLPQQTDKGKPGLYWTFQTDKGDIVCKLYEVEAPVTVRTMVGLALGKISYVDPATGQTMKKRFFDGLTFHRVIPDFMIQGGDPLGNGTGHIGGPGFPFKDEFVPSLKFNGGGRLAMANSGPNTNGSQFFITEGEQSDLNGKHTIWGQCGNNNVEKAIARVKADDKDKPRMPVYINKVIIERVGPAPADAPEAMPAGN